MRLWIGALISTFGDTLTWMALIWYVVERSGSGESVGTVLLCFALPAALTGGPIGRLLDRWQPRTIMVWDNLIRAVVIGFIPLLEAIDQLPLVTLYILAGIAGALAPATQAGVRMLLPKLVADKELEAANAAFAMTAHIPTVLGPAVAGALIAAWGGPHALIVDAATFLFMAWALSGMPDLPRGEMGTETRRTGPKELLRYPAVVIVTLLTSLFYFSYGPTEAAMPLFVKQVLNTDARGLGIIWSALGVGAILGGLTTEWLSRRVPTGVLLPLIMCLWGTFQLLFAHTQGIGFALICFFFGGVVWGPYTALETTLIQRSVPAEQHGQVFGIRAALLSPTTPLGTALGGFLLRFLTASHVLALSSLACLIGGCIALTLPALRRAGEDR